MRGEPFRASDNGYDWLGPGIYFWENSPERALDFAKEKFSREKTLSKTPFVVGAIVELGLCLDMTTASSIEFVRSAYDLLRAQANKSGDVLPGNINGNDLLQRYLDCAVIKKVHEVALASGAKIQTVKGFFNEGKPLYENSGFYKKTHVQIAVCDPTCIKGVFRATSP